MADNIPDGILREHCLEAISRFDSGVNHQFADSTRYDVLFSGKRYPPKALVGLAAEILTGLALGPASICMR
jgi:5-methylcytosine-specific restriction protein A